MVTKSQKIRLGIFIAISLLALIIVVIILVAPKFLEVRDTYYVGFTDTSVSGLQKGGSVKYHGITVGHVSDVFIDPNDLKRVIIELNLDHGTPIRSDTQAQIALLGITGLKFIELKGGSAGSDPLPTGEFIQCGKSTSATLTDRAETLIGKTETVLDNLAALTTPEKWDEIHTMTENASATIAELHDVIESNKEALKRTIEHAERITADLCGITSPDTLGPADDPSAVRESDLVRLVNALNTALEHTNSVLADAEVIFSENRTDLSISIESLRESAEHLARFSRLISEDPSVLLRGARPKHAPDNLLESRDENR